MTYNTALIDEMLNTQFKDRLRSEGFMFDEVGASFHGYPTQFEGLDAELRPYSFRLRSNRATFIRGNIWNNMFEMYDHPTVYINVKVPEGTTAEEAFFALVLQAEREGGEVNVELV